MTADAGGAGPARDYGSEYSEDSLWRKIAAFAGRAGRETIEQVLVLYHCCLDGDTPVWAKTVIVSALGYFIAPLDAIPDLMPGVGFSDDLGAVAMALATVLAHVKPEHRRRAQEKMTTWFR